MQNDIQEVGGRKSAKQEGAEVTKGKDERPPGALEGAGGMVTDPGMEILPG